tara:strand:- start:472 stop:750 length:279 start_codon:yes stop_codon:yes gene_type:complete
MKDKIIKMNNIHKMSIIFRNQLNPVINQLINILQFKINDDLKNIYKFLPENHLIQISPYISKAKNFLRREAKISLELVSDKTIEYFIRLFYG